MLQDMNYATSCLPIPYKEWRIRPAWRWFCSKQAGKGSDWRQFRCESCRLLRIHKAERCCIVRCHDRNHGPVPGREQAYCSLLSPCVRQISQEGYQLRTYICSFQGKSIILHCKNARVSRPKFHHKTLCNYADAKRWDVKGKRHFSTMDGRGRCYVCRRNSAFANKDRYGVLIFIQPA